MIIRINQVPVDFTLEKERTFSDVTEALRAWAEGQNIALLGILADGKALAPDDQTPLAALATLDVEAVPAGERDLARVAVIARYFALLAHEASAPKPDVLADLHREYPAVRSAVFPLLFPFAPRVTPALEVLDGPWDQQDIQQAAQRLAIEAEALRKELQSPSLALAETLEVLVVHVNSLEALPALFQKGLDKDALALIVGLFTVLEDLGRRVARFLGQEALPTDEWNQFSGELQPFLKEAAAALEAGDYILLTDLLEYEITPRLKTVRDLFPGVENLDPQPELL